MSAQNTGILLVSQPVVQAFFSPFAGKLSDRVEPRLVASTGMGLIVVGLFLFSFLHDTTALPLIVFLLALLGLGFALFSSPNTNAIMGSVEKKSYGVASGMLSTMRTVGQVFSMGITVLVFALVLGRVKIEADNYPLFMQSLRVIFLIFTVLCLAGVFASLARGKVR
jgi:MFS family permease